MPVISLLTGGVNFSNWVIRIGSGENDTIKYGNFITAVINFLLMALVIFCFVKVMNNLASRTEKLLKKEEEAPAAPAGYEDLPVLHVRNPDRGNQMCILYI